MNLKWYGHASFRITSSSGVSIVTDPYPPERAGYAPVTEPADIVVISSDSDDFHCRADLIPGSPTVVNALILAQQGGRTTVHGIEIRAIEAMEALNHAFHDPDQNGMYRMEVDGLHIGHLGDVGNPLSDEQIAFFSGTDILLALAGGHPTIDLDDLKVAIDRIQPKYVVPMHFRTLRYKPRNTFWIESFLSYFPEEQIDFAFDTQADITRADLPESTRILVLSHAN
jgi:L-ascorbate metabolism protein UlaG (beta-lactamase superfamily)